MDSSTGPTEPGDAAADAVPDAPEPPCFEGNVTIQMPSDADSLASITCIRGSLTIDTASPITLPQLRKVTGSIVLDRTSPTITFPTLEVIGADLRVLAWGISTLSLPLLRDVAGQVIVDDAKVTSIDAPRLESVGSLTTRKATWLNNLSLPALRRISGDATFFLSGLDALTFPHLERIDGKLYVESMIDLVDVSLPRLREVAGAIELMYLNESMTGLTFPALEHVGAFRIDALSDQLKTLSFPALTHAGPVNIDAPGLTVLSLPSVVECGGLEIEDIALTTLRVPELKKSTGRIWLHPRTSGAAFLTSVELPKLEEAESLWLGELPQLASIHLPRLMSVANELLLVRAPRVAELSLPSLTSASGLNAYALATITTVSAPVLSGSPATRISLAEAPMLTAVSFPAVSHLERFEVTDLPQLTTLSLPAATAVKSIEISASPALTSMAFPELETVYGMNLFGLPKLTRVDVPQLASLDTLTIERAGLFADLGPLTTVPTSLKYLRLTNTGVASLTFPNLVEAQELLLSDNYALTTMSFPALRHVSTTAYVRYSPKLPKCAVDAINARLVTGSISTRDLAACPL